MDEGKRQDQKGLQRLMPHHPSSFILHPDPSHRAYIEALRRMTPEARLQRAFELGDFCRALFLHGLRRRFPEYSEEEVQKVYRERLEKCHNRNY